tara:strand:- start:94 stop:303 length:210 start_codon:yes stop_codon:yes gene_type:complete
LDLQSINKVMLITEITERKLTKAEYKKRESLKDKYDKTDMKKNFIKQYGQREGEQAYFATITKQAKKEA